MREAHKALVWDWTEQVSDDLFQMSDPSGVAQIFPTASTAVFHCYLKQ